jgi:hypothetical protein
MLEGKSPGPPGWGCAKGQLPIHRKRIQWNLDLSFFKGVEKTNECAKTINPETHFFKQKKSSTLSCFMAEFCLN